MDYSSSNKSIVQGKGHISEVDGAVVSMNSSCIIACCVVGDVSTRDSGSTLIKAHHTTKVCSVTAANSLADCDRTVFSMNSCTLGCCIVVERACYHWQVTLVGANYTSLVTSNIVVKTAVEYHQLARFITWQYTTVNNSCTWATLENATNMRCSVVSEHTIADVNCAVFSFHDSTITMCSIANKGTMVDGDIGVPNIHNTTILSWCWSVLSTTVSNQYCIVCEGTTLEIYNTVWNIKNPSTSVSSIMAELTITNDNCAIPATKNSSICVCYIVGKCTVGDVSCTVTNAYRTTSGKASVGSERITSKYGCTMIVCKSSSIQYRSIVYEIAVVSCNKSPRRVYGTTIPNCPICIKHCIFNV